MTVKDMIEELSKMQGDLEVRCLSPHWVFHYAVKGINICTDLDSSERKKQILICPDELNKSSWYGSDGA